MPATLVTWGPMAAVGHHVDAQGRSAFCVFAPRKHSLAVRLLERGERLVLNPDDSGHWHASTARLPHGTLYLIEVDGRTLPDPASRGQPQGVHGPSMVCDIEPALSPGWRGVAIADAILYELHIGSFTPEGTLAAAARKLPHLRALGVNVLELMPLAAFPGERNWGYDGVYPFALHPAYGEWRDLRAFLEAAHAQGLAVILDLVCNHFGPEGHHGGAFAPYTQHAKTPWGAAVNFDGPDSHGVRRFFLENLRHWLQDVGFDGLRMDAVSQVFDRSTPHFLRECTELARRIGRKQGREVLMIAEHLRNDRRITSPEGYGFDAQWNDDLHHALFARLTGERGRPYAGFGTFDDVLRALREAFVLDGTRFDRVHRCFLGSDGRHTAGHEHVVYLQNHDQVGNRLHGDRLIASHGRQRALLGITAVMASPYVPLLFMGEEYGETAPFFFFEDFTDPKVIAGCRAGRRAGLARGGAEPPDPHARATFLASKLQWQRAASSEGQRLLAHYRTLIAWKRCGALGPRQREQVHIEGDAATQLITVRTPRTLTVMNFSARPRRFAPPPGWTLRLASDERSTATSLQAHAALVFGNVTLP